MVAGTPEEARTGSRGPRAIVWLRPEQARFVREICDRAALDVVGVGGPGRVGTESSAALGVPSVGSLRDALAEGACDVLWLHAPDANDDALDHAADSMLARAVSRGVRVATTEPLPASLLDSDAPGLFAGEPGAPRLARVPGAWYDDLSRSMGESLQAFGGARAGVIEALCAPRHGTLAMALMHAVELALALAGAPESIDAVYTQRGPSAGLHTLPHETLADLSGSISAVLRYADGRGLTLFASDAGGAWSRCATLIGPGGVIRSTTQGWTWADPQGVPIDASTPATEAARPDKPAARGKRTRRPAGGDLFRPDEDSRRNDSLGEAAPASEPATELYAAALRALVRGPWPLPVTDRVTPLAVAQAALLSARTGNAESPETMRRLSRR